MFLDGCYLHQLSVVKWKDRDWMGRRRRPNNQHQGCPIGIPKNPDISGSSRKNLLGAAEEGHSARARYRESSRGRGVVAELSTKKSVDSSKNRSVEYRDLGKSVRRFGHKTFFCL